MDWRKILTTGQCECCEGQSDQRCERLIETAAASLLLVVGELGSRIAVVADFDGQGEANGDRRSET